MAMSEQEAKELVGLEVEDATKRVVARGRMSRS
jgi:hypothetical protein